MDADEQRDLQERFDGLETHLRQRISNLLAKLGSKLFDISRRLDEHDDTLDDHDVRLQILEKALANEGIGTGDLRFRQMVAIKAIKRRMEAYFNNQELDDLIVELLMDVDQFAGNKPERILRLILYFYRRGTLDLLMSELKKLRPNVEWPQV